MTLDLQRRADALARRLADDDRLLVYELRGKMCELERRLERIKQAVDFETTV